jgi:hypothetical protein
MVCCKLYVILTFFPFITPTDKQTDIELNLKLPVQSVPITTSFVSSNRVHDEVYSIQHYVIKFVSDLRQVSGFSPDTNKMTATI